MVSKDIFAPPSADELKQTAMFAAPTKDELDSFKPKDKYSALETGLNSAVEGATMGLDDEALGALNALSDIPSKGADLNALLDSYRSGRDARRENKAQMKKEHPGVALAGNLVGGLAPAILSGGTSLGALALQGGIAGLGASDADLTSGNLADAGQAALDTAGGAALGAGLGAAAKYAPSATALGGAGGAAIGAGTALLDKDATADDVLNRALTGAGIGLGVGALGGSAVKGAMTGADKLIGTSFIPGMIKGAQGIDITVPKFGEDVYAQAKNLADEAAVNPVLEQKKAEADVLAKSKDLYEKTKLDTVKGFQKDIDGLMADQDAYKQASLAQQTADKSEHFEQLSKHTNRLADDFERNFNDLEKDIGKNINKVYETAGDVYKTPINMQSVVDEFSMNLPKDSMTPKMEKILTNNSGDVSLQQTRELRDLFWSLKNSPDTNIRQAARDGYKAVNEQVQSELGLLNPELAETLKLNNYKYSTLMNIRDNFVNYKGETNRKIINTMKKFTPLVEQPTNTNEMFNKSAAQDEVSSLLDNLQKVNPEFAQKFENQNMDLANSTKAINDIKPQIADTDLPNQDKISELKNLIDQAKGNKFQPPEINKKFTQFSDEPLDVAKKFMNYIQDSVDKKKNLSQQAELDSFFKDLESTKGPEFASKVKNQMQKISSDYKMFTPETISKDVFTIPGAGRTALKASAVVGNKLGLKSQQLDRFFAPTATSATQATTETRALIGNDSMKNLDPMKINELKSSTDNTSQMLGAMLEKISEMPKDKQTASLFAITQNPVYRNKLNTESKDNKR